MAYVNVPKDLNDIKSAFAFGLTGTQLGIFASGVPVVIPVYFMARGAVGIGPALFLMILSGMPFAFFALFHWDGMSAKKWLQNILRQKIYPQQRIYKTKNFYTKIDKATKEAYCEQKNNPKHTTKKGSTKRKGTQGKQKS
ncbi:MAG: PrgI family protein [Defluviitaleaceae bacterium]|nr:PrgI family protein [Defluviitaleaceae bacterium]